MTQLNHTAMRQPVHPTITSSQIDELVDEFYRKVRSDAVLGGLFEHNMTAAWDVHSVTMKSFWRAVLLKTGEYKGKPVPAHQKIDGLTRLDFHRWLELFDHTVKECIDPAAGSAVAEIARRIATSLWMSRSMDPMLDPPVWPEWTDHPPHDQ